MVWGYDFEGGTCTVDVHIQRLRHKLHLENHIKTIAKAIPGKRGTLPGIFTGS